MTPANERRKTSILPWLAPALLAIIAALMVLGGNNMIQSIRDLRTDVNSGALRTEQRLTHLEDLVAANQTLSSRQAATTDAIIAAKATETVARAQRASNAKKEK
jgi:cell division protein FtsB